VEADRVAAGVAELESLGFRVQVPEGLYETTAYTAGPPERRVQELHRLFSDGDVAGIVCARGGAGSARLLPLLDAVLLADHPKVFVGYSDITFLHLFLARLGMVSFHGPMAARGLTAGEYDRASLLHAFTGEGSPYRSEVGELAPLRPGYGEGRIRGGCLSILAAAVGTPWSPLADEEGTLLFVEDVDEKPYRVERMLVQLRQARVLDGVTGIVFGEMRGCGPREDEDYSLEQVVLGALDGLDLPVAFGLPSGHTDRAHATLPLGAWARLDCGQAARLEVLEPGVS